MEKRNQSTSKKKHENKVAQVMHKFKEGHLYSGKSENIVTNHKQAIAIALSEADELVEETANKK